MTTPSTVRYKRPPIIERVLSAVTECSEEQFYAKIESWKGVIQEHFPIYDPVKEWRLNLEEKDGIPFVSTAEPELRITHRFWRLDKDKNKYLSMRITPTQLTINIHPQRNDPHNFDELLKEFSEWAPLWMNHFELKGCSALQLDYINLISAVTTPQFVNERDGIQIGKVLTVFAVIPGKFTQIVPPYHCEVNLVVDEARKALFGMRLVGLFPEMGQPPGVRLDFRANMNNERMLKTPNDVLSQAQFLHTVIINQFEAVFTSDAKKSFEPITQC